MAETREAILARLRQGRETAPFEGECSRVASFPAQQSRDPQRDWRMAAEALEPQNGGLLLAGDAAEAAGHLQEFFQQHGVRQAVRWRHPLLEMLGLDAWLEQAGVSLLEPAGQAGEKGVCPQLDAADAGITAADAFFARAGTLVLMAGAGRLRSASLVPPLHVAFVPQSLLYEDLSSLPELLREKHKADGRLPSAVHLITGSSSTADIEQTLVRPAHGPARVLVIGLRWL